MAVESGQWRVGSRVWVVGSWQGRVGSREWSAESGKWRVGSGEWAVESGQWRVGSGEWVFKWRMRVIKKAIYFNGKIFSRYIISYLIGSTILAFSVSSALWVLEVLFCLY